MATAVRAFQIFYDAATRGALDPDFEPLDNSANERPDWFEYWPIRGYLRGRVLDESGLYGFFSPRFYSKTHLRARQVREFAAQAGDAEVVTFSPFPCHAACFYNVFEQGENHHPGLADVAVRFLRTFDPAFSHERIVNHTGNTVYCNFFLARPAFWREWSSMFERLFEFAEDAASPLYAALNAREAYVKVDGSSTPAQLKIFVAERIASLLLTSGRFATRNYPPFSLPLSPPFAGRMAEIVALDALKIAYTQTAEPEYLKRFVEQRDRLAGSVWFGAKA